MEVERERVHTEADDDAVADDDAAANVESSMLSVEATHAAEERISTLLQLDVTSGPRGDRLFPCARFSADKELKPVGHFLRREKERVCTGDVGEVAESETREDDGE